jgi:hypothetical protein
MIRAKSAAPQPEVYQGNSVAAAGVAAHEVGHALQDAEGYAPLRLRSTMVPAVQIGSWVGPLMFMGGLLMQFDQIAIVGLVLFSLTALFAFVTLPVEFNATSRAKAWLADFWCYLPAGKQGRQCRAGCRCPHLCGCRYSGGHDHPVLRLSSCLVAGAINKFPDHPAAAFSKMR